MQDGFLFDESTGKGKGCDRLGTKKDGLKLKWRWSRVCEMSWCPGDKRRHDQRRLPCQTCSAKKGDFEFEVVLWHTHYEARVEYKGEHLTSFNKEIDDTIEWKGEVLIERVQAQLKAEKLLIDFYKMLMSYLAENLF